MLQKIVIDENLSGQRADRFVKKWLTDLSLTRIHTLFRKREVKINGKPISREVFLKVGEILFIYGLKEFEIQKQQFNDFYKKSFVFKLPILWEDKDLLVIDKPQGLATHTGTGIKVGSSIIEQVYKYLKISEYDIFKPSPIHRLDKETSGVMLIGKTAFALREWNFLWKNHKVKKKYIALVEGVFSQKEGEINFPLSIQSVHQGPKVRVSENQNIGKKAKTYYRVLKKLDQQTLLDICIETGRTHQIRVHLAKIGHPIVGDTRYGNGHNQRLKLHAYFIQSTAIKPSVLFFSAPEWLSSMKNFMFETLL